MALLDSIRADLRVNDGNIKGKVITLLYRISNFGYQSKSLLVKILCYPVQVIYTFSFTWVMGIEIPYTTKIGAGLQVWHGTGLVVNAGASIGKNVLLRHNTTIGNKGHGTKSPVIGDNVQIGAHSLIIGDIEVGDNVIIGAGSIVVKSIPSNSVAYGNPLKVIRNKENI